MPEQDRTASRRKFYSFVAGKTNRAHEEILQNVKELGQVQVGLADCDYLLVFCPVTSRVETDINEALSKVTERSDKPILLVVMHHTFDPEHVIVESRRQVHHRDVFLTVDFLFYEGRILSSELNDTSGYEIQKVLGVRTSRFSRMSRLTRYWRKRPLLIIFFFIGTSLIIYQSLVWYRQHSRVPVEKVAAHLNLSRLF